MSQKTISPKPANTTGKSPKSPRDIDHTTVHTVKAFLFGPYSDTQLIFGLKFGRTSQFLWLTRIDKYRLILIA